jgi:hypothetical protein
VLLTTHTILLRMPYTCLLLFACRGVPPGAGAAGQQLHGARVQGSTAECAQQRLPGGSTVVSAVLTAGRQVSEVPLLKILGWHCDMIGSRYTSRLGRQRTPLPAHAAARTPPPPPHPPPHTHPAHAAARAPPCSWFRSLLVSLPESVEGWRERNKLVQGWARLLK